ncbi:hypothetical protein DICPUDRAFT_148123 [Dictyostelium purpureum]|uniref:Pherophorin domain-containing protein n=1 Tax=Dictyostelium purpureum TaxID=5786 RepID=F0ZAB4_DICPU|nr:uncharacterized protein DICPUDRAFT_148123 [Dictyostelium purpureum]EGC39094.1 hypothetical protein DICPUDRAFT_148123 [Dictyostelium purpureum]|eukprot:XP_003284346.1 hypothetical protein DICPUDRAFT_148123 [Dictyostelium purpureum]
MIFKFFLLLFFGTGNNCTKTISENTCEDGFYQRITINKDETFTFLFDYKALGNYYNASIVLSNNQNYYSDDLGLVKFGFIRKNHNDPLYYFISRSSYIFQGLNKVTLPSDFKEYLSIPAIEITCDNPIDYCDLDIFGRICSN